MKVTKQFILLFIILITEYSFADKELNEYGKWLKFYNLNEDSFRQDSDEHQIESSLIKTRMNSEIKNDFEKLLFYSPDSQFFLDLYSYRFIVSKDSAGNPTWVEHGQEQKIQLVQSDNLLSTTVNFLEPTEYAETAIWRSKDEFEILGFNVVDELYFPTIWKFNLSKKIYKKYRCHQAFNELPNNYLTEIKFK
jgi:hypothetical protein